MTEAKKIYAQLVVAFEAVLSVSASLNESRPPLKMDTVFALGETLGVIMKAKALLGRDIDDANGWDAATAPVHQVSEELRQKIARDMKGEP